MLQRVTVIDSHTGGEPTRVVISGGPDLGRDDFAARRERFRCEHDPFRSAVVNEPRGSDVLVGAMLCAPSDPTCAAGAIFFNNVGYLGDVRAWHHWRRGHPGPPGSHRKGHAPA